ncbi:MAG: ABC transporter substrate-binding protein, partial [Polyangiaceae bacterium]
PGRPYLDAIEWTTAMPVQTQRYRFEEGSLDVVRELTLSDSARFEADPRWRGLTARTTGKTTNAIFLNTEVAPFDRVAVRRAVSLAIDPSFLSLVRTDVAETDRVLPPSVPGPEREKPMRVHDLQKALAMMAEAGLGFDPETGEGGWDAPIDYVTVPDSFEQQAAEVYAQQLSKIGLRVRLKLLPFASYLAEVSRRRATAMGWTGWTADFPDPSNFFEPTLSSQAIQDEGSQNVAFFASAELDRVLTDARSEHDRAKRMALYARAEEIVRDNAPWVPTSVPRPMEVRQPYVRGYRTHPILPAPLAEVWLDAAARAVASASCDRSLIFFGAAWPGSSAQARCGPHADRSARIDGAGGGSVRKVRAWGWP